MMGHAFILTGHGRLASFDRTAAFFTDLGIPLPVLIGGFVSKLELVAGRSVWAGPASLDLLLSKLVNCAATVDARLEREPPAHHDYPVGAVHRRCNPAKVQ